jgi:uncharacterized protein (DUF885 family)
MAMINTVEIVSPIVVLLAVQMAFGQTPAIRPDADTANAASAQLHKLFDERYKWELDQYPEMAMSRGDYSHADRVTDNSLAGIQSRHDKNIEFLHRLSSVDRDALSPDDVVNYELFALELQNSIDGNRFRTFLAPIGGRFGPQQDIPQMAERVRFNSAEDYSNYLKRLEQAPKVVDNVIERLKLGIAEKRTPPQVVVMGVKDQFAALLEGDGLKALAEPLTHLPATIDAEEAKKLKSRFDSVSLPAAREALAKLDAYFEKDYLPNCRQTIAAIDWPEGQDYYNYQLRVMTTTDLTANEIHELGLSEVKRIKAEMMKVIRSSDYMKSHPEAEKQEDQALFNSFVKYLRTDPRFYYTSERDLVTGYRDICKQVDAQLPKFFKTLPRLPYGVKEIPSFMAPQQTTAYYQQGDIRNAEPGFFMVNTFKLNERPKYEMITLSMHESVPGHHLQIALAQEMPNQPEFRKDAWFTAFGEGWALYSERLAIEMGLINNPYDDFGRLTYEMWRACRLVVDPGMHALGWSRERAVQFMLDNTALSELNINNEIDRYIAWPGQAVAYKIGELKIRALREHADQELGKKFDIREFHDVVLGAGTVPLSVLERRVGEWIEALKKSK